MTQKQTTKCQEKVTTKQVQVSYGCAQGDLNVKVAQVQKFLREGHRVKLLMKLKGRENAHADIGLAKLKSVVELVCDVQTVIEKPATLDGKNIVAQLKSKKRNTPS
jgi:translation initiation factor IF-3